MTVILQEDFIRSVAGALQYISYYHPTDYITSLTKAYEREHELALTHNARELLAQTERALARIEEGTYGTCESCGEPIGKARLQAFPRATLCVECKQREERR